MKLWIARYQLPVITLSLIGGFVVGGVWLLNWLSGGMAGQWETNLASTLVPLNEIMPVGERDGMTPIDNPVWQPASEATWLADKSPVIALYITQPARAYPLAVLIRHGVVNDWFEDQVVAVTFCPLCNSPMVYDRRVNGQTLRFGTTGTLYNGGLLMWDDTTQSWWQQFTGEALVGDYAGTQLVVVPSQLVGFATFLAHDPDGVVLRGDASLPPVSYGRNPYIGYDTEAQPLLFSGSADKRLPATQRVLAAVVNGQPIAYPFTVLSAAGVVNDVIAGWPVVAFWQAGSVSALDNAKIDQSRDVGMAALFSSMVEGMVLTFEMDGAAIVDLQTRSTWDIFGEATSGALRGTILTPHNAQPVFWFAWAANYPATELYSTATTR